MTKPMTSVAVMQLVERELVGLDDDVRSFVPELKDIQVLQGFENIDSESKLSKRAVYQPLEGKLTLRYRTRPFPNNFVEDNTDVLTTT